MTARFWAKVSGGTVDTCWLWRAATDPAGYGRFNLGTGRGTTLAHRYAYAELRHEIPPGLVLDHLCRTPACVNPWHLEPVTHAVNYHRGIRNQQRAEQTHCIHGHRYTPENTYVIPNSGSRCCRTCKHEAARARWSRDKAARIA